MRSIEAESRSGFGSVHLHRHIFLEPRPHIVQVGFIARTPRGRVATAAGFQHMGLAAPSKAPTGGTGSSQGRLF